MTHIETLVMNEIRKALENLEKQGIGYIDCEQTGVIHQRRRAGSPDFCKSWEECPILRRIFFL